MSKSDYTIVGGGASGILLLVQLLNKIEHGKKILVVNSGYPLARGIAYSTTYNHHLLNVRAARMSMFPGDPNDFCKWINATADLQEWQNADLPERFVPRAIYGRYLQARMEEAILNHSGKASVEFIDGEVTDIEKSEGFYTLTLKDSRKLLSSRVALCTGNFTATALPGIKDFTSDDRVVINPWNMNSTGKLSRTHPVMILGSGLTMADTVLNLLHDQFEGPVYVLSRHGKLPVTHPPLRLHYPDSHEFIPEKNLHLLFRQIKQRIYEVSKNGFWEEPVLEALRPHTQKLWQEFPIDEKKRFLRHLNHKWSGLRHRLPMEVSAQIQAMIHSGQMKLIAGNLHAVEPAPGHLKVSFHHRQDGRKEILEVQRLVNCAGPEQNLERIKMPLIKNLLKRGMIRPCALKLGYDASPDGKIIDGEGALSRDLFTMGPGLKGILWESVAIPELRVQAANLAEIMIRD